MGQLAASPLIFLLICHGEGNVLHEAVAPKLAGDDLFYFFIQPAGLTKKITRFPAVRIQ